MSHPLFHFNLRTWLFLLQFVCLTIIFGQKNPVNFDKSLEKIKKQFKAKQYEKVVSGIDKELKKPGSKKVVEFFYLKGISLWEMSQMPKYKAKPELNLFRKAVQTVSLAVQKDTIGDLREKYKTLLEPLVLANNKEALESYSTGRYARAALQYMSSFELTGDTQAYAMTGLSYWKDKKTNMALPIFKNVALWNYNAIFNGTSKRNLSRESFEILSNFYLDKNEVDSAYRFTEMGLYVFPYNSVLKTNMKELLISNLIEQSKKSITDNFIQTVNKGLEFFPADTVFLLNQNFYYLDKILKRCKNKFYGAADSILLSFYEAKQDRIKQKVENKEDVFLTQDSAQFLFQLFTYYLRINSTLATVHYFEGWYKYAFQHSQFDEKLYEKLLSKPDPTVSRRLLMMMFSVARENYPKNNNFKNYRSNFLNQWVAKKPKYKEFPLLIELNKQCIADNPNNLALQKTLTRNYENAIDSAIEKKEVQEAWSWFHEYKTKNKNIVGNTQHERLAKLDFQIRYFGTRIGYTKKGDKKVANTGWTGNTKNCDAGELPDSTLAKVIKRINYFRDNAGIVEKSTLSMDRVQGCQEAAVMFSQKGLFSNKPTPESYNCYTQSAKEMAAVGQGVMESNPAQCVTILCSDDKSEELINRQSILNPTADYIGFGSADVASVFVFGFKGKLADTQSYATQAVCWPPSGFCPAMLLFKTWSFSILADSLQNVFVEIKDKQGNKIPNSFKLSKFDKLLLKTIVIEPEFNSKEVRPGDVFSVQIKYNNKIYSYKTTII